MNILKSILNLFKKKKKVIPVQTVKHLTEIDGEHFEIEHPIADPKDYPSVVTATNRSSEELQPSAPPLKLPFNPKEFASRKPRRERKIVEVPIISTATKVFVSPEFDHTPNPLKYWRRFKRGGKVYYKKFYHEQIVLP